MKTFFTTSILIIVFLKITIAQNVGIGNTDPKATLDIKGDLIFRVDTLNLINGINDNIDITTSRSMNYILTGPNTTFELGGFTGGKDGRIITLYNSTPAAYYVVNYSALTIPTNQINTGTGANVTMNSYSTITFQYLALDSLWHMVSANGKIEASSDTYLSSSQLDTSILANFVFTTEIGPILAPLHTISGNVKILGVADDVSSAIINLPFNFIFDAEPYSHFIANANGFLKLLPNAMGNIPSPTYENNLNLNTFHPILAPLWDDLHLSSIVSGIYILTEGIEPERVFNVEWIGKYYGVGGNDYLRFRISIFESNGKIQFSYFETEDPPINKGGLSAGIGSIDNEISSVDVGNNSASNQIIKNDNFLAPIEGRYYSWNQNLTTVSDIIISTPFVNQKLNINGDLILDGNLSAEDIFCLELHESSDENLKRNITPILSSIQNILKINPVNYFWKKDENDNNLKTGVIAQELQKIYPELVSSDKEGQLAVHYTGLIAPLIKAVQEQQSEIEMLQKEIMSLKVGIKEEFSKMRLLINKKD